MGKKSPGRVSKLHAWFRAYTDESNQLTFLNKTESSRAAGYKTENEDSLRNIGCQNFRKLSGKIEQFFDDDMLSESALKAKMSELLHGKQTIFQKVKGAVKESDLKPGWRIVATSGIVSKTEEGNDFGDGDTLLACDVEFPELQRRTLDMALKVRGMYAPEKRELTGKDGGPVELRHSADPMSIEALRNAIAAAPQK